MKPGAGVVNGQSILRCVAESVPTQAAIASVYLPLSTSQTRAGPETVKQEASMNYRTLGRTGLRVSEIGFGCGNVELPNLPVALYD